MKYSHLAWTAVIAAFAVSLGAAPAAAKGGSSNTKKPTVRAASAKPASATTKAAKAPKVKATGATKAKTSGPVTSKPSAAAKPTVSSNPPSSNKPAVSSTNPDSKPTVSSNPPNETRPTDTDPLPGVTLNKAQQLLMKNDNLRLKMQTRLGGLDPIAAASDFRNLGQFVAAVNASYNNPGVIEFKALKFLMTGDPPMSLGQAKQQLMGTATTTATSPTATTTAAKKTKTKGRS
jgi:hypothetical protein